MTMLASLRRRLPWLVWSCLVLQTASAANVFDWSPSVSLTDSFGVAEGLCPDIAGFRASLNCGAPLQLHTCKAGGDDTQFVLDFDTNELRTVLYDVNCGSISEDRGDGACVTILGGVAPGAELGLAACDGSDLQALLFREDDATIRPVANPGLCLAKTSEVGPAGPNERTDFALVACDAAAMNDVAWTVSPGPPSGYGTQATATEAPSSGPVVEEAPVIDTSPEAAETETASDAASNSTADDAIEDDDDWASDANQTEAMGAAIAETGEDPANANAGSATEEDALRMMGAYVSSAWSSPLGAWVSFGTVVVASGLGALSVL